MALQWLSDAFAESADPAWDGVFAAHALEVADSLDAAAAAGSWRQYARNMTPDRDKVFRALRRPPGEIRVVILGQDPYPERGVADGLCFSTRCHGAALPYSLKQILSAAGEAAGGGEGQHSGRLDNWAEQGAMLLNCFLTTVCGTPRAHPFWTDFTDAVIERVAARGRGVHFLLWGGDAHKKEKIISPYLAARGHTVHKHSHPAAVRYGHPFSTCDHFAAVSAAVPSWDWRTSAPLEIYTDGSCLGENRRAGGGRAGGGVVIMRGPGVRADDEAREIEVPVPGAQTNQRAEVVALHRALEICARTVWPHARIFTDSKYAMMQAQGRWKFTTNGDLIVPLREAYARADASPGLEIVRMDGHGRDKNSTQRQIDCNERADAVAKRAAEN